jgi:hypothetical protein
MAFRVLLVFAWLFQAQLAKAQIPETVPRALPAPPWNIWLTVEQQKGSAAYCDICINSANPSCTDTSNPTGTFATPRCSIPTLSNLAAGTVVRFFGGTYTGSILSIGGSGTEANPIFIVGGAECGRYTAHTCDTAMDRQWRLGNGQNATWMYVQGFDFTSVADPALDIRPSVNTLAIHHIVVRGNVATGTGTGTGAGFGVSGIAGAVTEYVAMIGNYLHDFGDPDAAAENDLHCFTSSENTRYGWWLHNEAFRCSGDSLQIGHGDSQDTDAANHMYVGFNKFYQNGENALDFKQIHDIIVAENDLYGPHNSQIDGNQCLVIHYGPVSGQGLYNGWFINNRLHHCRAGNVSSANRDDKPNWFIGNLLYRLSDNATPAEGSEAYAFSHSTSGGHENHYHNTIANVSGGFTEDDAGQEHKYGGNIVANVNIAGGFHHFFINSNPTVTVEKELYYQAGGSPSISWRGTTYTSNTAWDTAQASVTGGITADPKFVDPDNDDYSLQADSPAIGAGVDMSTIEAAFQAEFGGGVTLLYDINGTTRPNGVWDIGAYQYADAPASNPLQYRLRRRF